MFKGTITLSPNPVATNPHTFIYSFSPIFVPGRIGYRALQMEDRADGGSFRARFYITGGKNFLRYMMHNSLGSLVTITDEGNQWVWEGLLWENELNTGVASYRITLQELYNNVKIRYRITGAGVPTISTPLTDAESIAKYGVREYVMTGGELESAIVADQPVQQFLNMHKTPKAAPVEIGSKGLPLGMAILGVTDRPHLAVTCRGIAETLDWEIYENAGAGTATASLQIQTVLTAKAQFVTGYTLGANNTQVSTQYETDRRAGGIIRDIIRLGDDRAQRWVGYFIQGQHFIYEQAAASRIAI